jgi:deoxyribose-phosphate aldolase
MNIAAYIDHTILKPETGSQQILKLCTEAMEQCFAAVCVPPYFVRYAHDILKGSNVKLATVIGFPFGYSATSAKIDEISKAIHEGADELDVVHNLTAFKDFAFDYAVREIQQCTDIAHDAGKVIKVIVESGSLKQEELIHCCELYAPLGIDFMKTSTGFAEIGATAGAVQTMRQHLPASVQIKASGGIRNFAFAKELIDAGATRIGCSASMQILKEASEATN